MQKITGIQIHRIPVAMMKHSADGVHFKSGWLVLLALALSACGGVGNETGISQATPADESSSKRALALAAQPQGARVALSYSVVNLSLSLNAWASPKSINASGQVAFIDRSDGYGGKFYDGSSVRDIGSLGGSTTSPQAVDNSGRVVGNSTTSTNAMGAFLWDSNLEDPRMIPLVASTGRYGESASALAISESGYVTGNFSGGYAEPPYAYRWKSDTDTNTNTGASRLSSDNALDTSEIGYGVNDSGQVVGWRRRAGAESVFFWDPASPAEPVDLWPASSFSDNFINKAGQVAGRTEVPGGLPRAVFWDRASGIKDLHPTGSVEESAAVGLNDAGQVAIRSSGRAYLWNPTSGMKDIGLLNNTVGARTYPVALNNHGQIVGSASLPNQTGQTAFAWAGGEIVELKTRLPNAPKNIELYEALAVSDNGSIVASSNMGLVLLKPGVESSAAPTIGPVSANDPLAVNLSVAVSATFADADIADTHVAQWSWGDGSNSTVSVTERDGSGSVGGSHVYAAAGVYTVSLTLTDSTGRSTQVSRDVVIYDPSAGYASGNGFFSSPAGAYQPDAANFGRVKFAFMAQYQSGTLVPSGQTEFSMKTGKLDFSSRTYDWLVVRGARAQYKGSGQIDGMGSYQFMLTTIDGSSIGSENRVRIRIWHLDPVTKAEVVDYDSGTAAGTEGTDKEGTILEGGMIKIRR